MPFVSAPRFALLSGLKASLLQGFGHLYEGGRRSRADQRAEEPLVAWQNLQTIPAAWPGSIAPATAAL